MLAPDKALAAGRPASESESVRVRVTVTAGGPGVRGLPVNLNSLILNPDASALAAGDPGHAAAAATAPRRCVAGEVPRLHGLGLRRRAQRSSAAAA